MFVICFVYVVKRLEHLIKLDMALYKSYVLLIRYKSMINLLCNICDRFYGPGRRGEFQRWAATALLSGESFLKEITDPRHG